jgi:hypothetical protein
MDRLIAFGCSNTYGYGLEDCWKESTNPSNIGWVSIISRELNKICVNKAVIGSSNKLIWHQITNTHFESSDTVIILWSYVHRYTVLKNRNSFTHLHPHTLEQEESKEYYRLLYSDYDAETMSKLYIDHANNYLSTKGVKVYQSIVHRRYAKLFGNHSYVKKYFCDYERYYDKAPDNVHLGLDGNIAFAKDFLQEIGYNPTIVKPEPVGINKIAKWLRL